MWKLIYCQQFADMKPLAVERIFRLPILDVSTGMFEASRDILGTIDLIADGEVIEVKTSARSINQHEADTSMQLTLYSWVYRLIRGEEEKGLKTIVLLKTSKPSIQVVETYRTADYQSRLMELISQVIRAVELRVFYRNPSTKYGCDGCVYRTTPFIIARAELVSDQSAPGFPCSQNTTLPLHLALDAACRSGMDCFATNQ